MLLKFKLYLPLCFETVEQYLIEMEQAGYRLDHIRAMFFFYFVPSKQRTVHYVFTYGLPNHFAMTQYDLFLRQNNGIIVYQGKLITSTLYRVTNLNVPLDELILFRRKYAVKACMEICFVLFCQIVLLLLLIFRFAGDIGHFYLICWMIGLPVLFIFIVFLINLFVLLLREKG